MANILKPALARGAAVHWRYHLDEYRKHIERDAALEPVPTSHGG